MVYLTGNGIIDTSASASARLEDPVIDDPALQEWPASGPPVNETSGAAVSVPGASASATAEQTFVFDPNRIQATGAIDAMATSDGLSFADYSARSDFTMRFDIFETSAYTFSGSVFNFDPSTSVIDTQVSLVQIGGTFSNFATVIDDTEIFNFSGLLEAGRYELRGSVSGSGSALFPDFSSSTVGSYSIDLQVVPIPAAVWLFGSALLTVGGLRRWAGK